MQQARKPDTGFTRFMLSLLGSFMIAFSIHRFRKYHVPMYFMGVFGGFFMGIFVTLAFSIFSGSISFYLMGFLCGFSMTYYTYKAYEMNQGKQTQRWLFKLWATSIMGSYLVMRGFSTVIGGYPSEIDMLADWAAESRGEASELTLSWTYYLYLTI
jgi:hypothetical protein